MVEASGRFSKRSMFILLAVACAGTGVALSCGGAKAQPADAAGAGGAAGLANLSTDGSSTVSSTGAAGSGGSGAVCSPACAKADYCQAGICRPRVTEFPGPGDAASVAEPFDIVAGPDGALWFSQPDFDMIGRCTTDGEITEFTLPTAFAKPTRLAPGPDGNVWFVE